jgi:diaminopimelate decarboxylase/aspartate kinase
LRSSEKHFVINKFGGTSVATAARWRSIRAIVEGHRSRGNRVVVVCSALSGVTNALERLLAQAARGEGVDAALDAIWNRHLELVRDLDCEPGPDLVATMDQLRALARGLSDRGAVTPREHAAVMAHGELMSTRLGAAWLRTQGLSAQWQDAREILRALPAPEGSSEAQRYLSATCAVGRDDAVCQRLDDAASVIVTQGFIASDERGDTVLLGRGGSDTSAAYVASKLDASRLEIWTDVHGMFTANPKALPDARLVPELTYAEAQTLAGLGARVLHPRCLRALHEQQIPLVLGATQRPNQGRTAINGFAPRCGVKAIVSRDKLCLLSMKRPAEWQPVGFMADVAGCFERMGLSMDLLSTSPGEIRATIDVAAFPDVVSRLDELREELGRVSEVRVTTDLSSVSLVGHQLTRDEKRYQAAMKILHGAHPELIAHAADDASLTYVLPREEAEPLVQRLHEALFGRSDARSPALGPSWRELDGPSVSKRSHSRASLRSQAVA